jgi:Alpha/beta hydrolase family
LYTLHFQPIKLSTCVNFVPLDLILSRILIVVTSNLLDSSPLTPLKPPFVGRSKMKTFTVTRSRTAPNGGRWHFSYDAAVVADIPAQDTPVPRPDEPNVYNLPTSLVPTYGALPLLAKVVIAMLSAWIAAASTFHGKLLWLRPFMGIAKNHPPYNKRMLVVFLLKTTVYLLLSNFALQEVLTPPSRISTNDLMNRFFLPSILSKYEPVALSDGQSLGVHFLQHDAPDSSPPQFSALYMNHGFGASSMSWLPAIPKLADRLRVKRTLAHDAVGFGFTDRPKDVNLYTPRTSSDIGLALLKSKAANSSSVILMGHSMGSFATLETAARIPDHVAVTVILVAPALGMLPKRSQNGTHQGLVRGHRVSPGWSVLLRAMS